MAVGHITSSLGQRWMQDPAIVAETSPSAILAYLKRKRAALILPNLPQMTQAIHSVEQGSTEPVYDVYMRTLSLNEQLRAVGAALNPLALLMTFMKASPATHRGVARARAGDGLRCVAATAVAAAAAAVAAAAHGLLSVSAAAVAVR